MALYSEKVMDHFMNPRNVGSIENASGVGEVGNAKCGDIMKIYLQIENEIIVDCKFETFGCGIVDGTHIPGVHKVVHNLFTVKSHNIISFSIEHVIARAAGPWQSR